MYFANNFLLIRSIVDQFHILCMSDHLQHVTQNISANNPDLLKAGNEEELTISRVNCATAPRNGGRRRQGLEVNREDGSDSSQSGFVSAAGRIAQSLLCYCVVSCVDRASLA